MSSTNPRGADGRGRDGTRPLATMAGKGVPMEIYLTHIVARSPEDLRALDVFGLDLKHRAARREAATRFVVPGVLTDDQVRELQQAGYEVEIVEDLSRVAAQRSED